MPQDKTQLPEIYSVYNIQTDKDRLTRNIHYLDHFVPRNFITDYTTSPTMLRWLVPRYGIGNLAAIIHDFYYTACNVKRKQADDYFYQILVASGVSRWNARLRWAGVRLIGWHYWNKPERAAKFRALFKIAEVRVMNDELR